MVPGSGSAVGVVTGSTLIESPPHILIAGCGYLGRRAGHRWQRRGAKISVVTRSKSKAAELAQAGFEPIICDLAQRQILSLPDVDTVLWSVGFDRPAGRSREMIWIDGLQHLLQQLPSTVGRFLYVSSTGVYGSASGGTVSESTAPQPASESGKCCLRAEKMLQRTFSDTDSSVSLTILRMAGMYGPGRLLRRISDLRSGIPLPGPAESYLNLIHIDDAVTAVAELAPCEDVPLLNAVNAGTLTRKEYYGELARIVGAPVPVFDESDTLVRGGNKRVISEVRTLLTLNFQFDDVKAGLRDAVKRGTEKGRESSF